MTVAQPALLTQVAQTNRTLTRSTPTNYTLTHTPRSYVNDVDALLAEAVWYIDAHQHTGTDAVVNLGASGAALNAQSGSTSGADTNDPKWLEYVATNYAYLPGVAGNSLTATAPATTDNYLATRTDNTTATASASAGAFTFSTEGSWKSIALRNSSNVVLTTVDLTGITSPTQTTLTGSGAETWTINRSSSGRKTALVGGWAGGGSLWLFGTDDYLEVADHADLDFGASDSFTVLAAYRRIGTLQNFNTIMMKKTTSGDTSAGFEVRANADAIAYALVGDGSVLRIASGTAVASGSLVVVAVRQESAQTVIFSNGIAGTPVTTAQSGPYANARPLRVGVRSDAISYPADMEFFAAAVFRRALTQAETNTLTDYFRGRAA